jgi:hypothetical protein
MGLGNMTVSASNRPIDSFSTLYRVWAIQGCSVRAAAALANAGTSEVNQIAEKGKAFWRRQRRNCGPAVAHTDRLIGGWPPTPSIQRRRLFAAALLLSLPADQHDEASDVAGDAISALTAAGL